MLIMAALPNRPLATPSMLYLGRYRKPSNGNWNSQSNSVRLAPGASMGSTR